MGTVGDAYDNAMAESFFSLLESELLQRRVFKTKADASDASMALFTWLRLGTTGCVDMARLDNYHRWRLKRNSRQQQQGKVTQITPITWIQILTTNRQ